MRGIALAALLIAALGACADPDAYRVATEAERSDVSAAVRDYYELRARLTEDIGIEDFWHRYPELERSYDLTRGINIEKFLWQRAHAADGGRKDYRVELEGYEPIRLFVRAAEALVFVHGVESWQTADGRRTIGEFRTVLRLTRGGDGWIVVRTDEQMPGERPRTYPPTR